MAHSLSSGEFERSTVRRDRSAAFPSPLHGGDTDVTERRHASPLRQRAHARSARRHGGRHSGKDASAPAPGSPVNRRSREATGLRPASPREVVVPSAQFMVYVPSPSPSKHFFGEEKEVR